MDEIYSRLTPEQQAYQKMRAEKLEFVAMPAKISAQQAHELALAAARLIEPSVMDDRTHREAAAMVAEAYLIAYEAVEGWTKPQAPTKPSDDLPSNDIGHPDYYSNQAEMIRRALLKAVTPFSGHMLMSRQGSVINIQCSKTKKNVTVIVSDHGTTDFMLPKDA